MLKQNNNSGAFTGFPANRRKSALLVFFITLVILAITGVSAHAEKLSSMADLKPGTAIFTYIYSKEQIAELNSIGLFFDKRFGFRQDCKENQQIKPYSLSLLQPINLPDGKVHPVAGAWSIAFSSERCGQKKIYNAIVMAKNGGKAEVKPYHPGITMASPLLLKDSMMAAYVSAANKLRIKHSKNDCKDIDLIDMNITQQPHDIADGGKTFKGVWQEKWTLKGCGLNVDVLMNFTPDGVGGTNYSTGDR